MTQKTDEEVVAYNQSLITDDDTPITCQDHNVTKRWGDLSPIAQLAILSGLDISGDKCIMED